MTRLKGLLALLLVLISASATAVTISCGAIGTELALCREGAQAWAKSRGVTVEVVSTPNSSTDRLALYQQLLAAGSADVDVFQIDVIWPGTLAAHFVDLAHYLEPSALQDHFATVVAPYQVDGRLVAVPWFVDTGLLYYRKDLLARHGTAVPTTWAGLTAAARRIQAAERATGNRKLWGFVFQGRAYEGLTCNALEWVASHGGGTIVAPDGTITVDNRQAAAALREAAGWVGTIVPPGVLNYDEEQARGAFQSGRAIFMRNWPYAYPLVSGPDSPVGGRVGVAPLPAGGEGTATGTLGGWGLAVSRYSREPDLAADLVRFLTGRAEQRRRALRGGYNPTYPDLYRDPELRAVNPALAVLERLLPTAVARPSDVTGREYNRVSSAFFGTAHQALSGTGEPDRLLRHLARRLERFRGEGW